MFLDSKLTLSFIKLDFVAISLWKLEILEGNECHVDQWRIKHNHYSKAARA